MPVTTSVFSAARPGSRTRLSAKCSAGSSEVPLSTISSTLSPMKSMKVSAPGSVTVNLTSLRVRKVSGPVVRSSETE